jgi:hypothetical protein
MLRLGRSRKPCRIGREKGKWNLLVLPILGKVKMYTPNEVPGLMTALEELLHGEPGFREFGIESRIHAAP